MADNREKRAVLLIAGHGSSNNPMSAGPTLRLAERLTAAGVFADVVPAFVKQEPKLGKVLDEILARDDVDEIVIVPNMTCRGYITTTVIPRDGGLSGPVTERAGADGRTRRIHLTDPIGTDERLTRAVLSDIARVMTKSGLKRADTGVLLVGHGSQKSRESFNQTAELAEAVMAAGTVSEAALAFLEEAPAIGGWKDRMRARNVIAVPFLIAPGLHGADDIPAELGIKNPKESLGEFGDAGVAGPFVIAGRNLWYLRPVGDTSVIGDVAIDRARRALRSD